MPLSVALNSPVPSATIAPPAFLEFDGPNGSGNQVAPVGPLSYSSASTNIASVDANGNVTQLAVGTAILTTTDTGNGLTASDTLTVIDTAVSATLNIAALPAAGTVAASAVARTAVKK